MTREEIMELDLDGIEARKAEIREEIKTADSAGLDAIEAEKDIIEERVAQLRQEIERRKADMAAVLGGKGRTIEKPMEDRTMTDIKEYRNSKEYVDMYADYMKSHDDTEIRTALLSTNATGGTIPVPDFVYDIVKTAWDRNEIMRLVPRENLPGNLKVSFEISGSDAVIHTEGSGAVSEEDLVEGIVTLIPEYAKKWKSFSKTVYALRGEAFVRYIYDEIAYRVFKVVADTLIGKIAALPQTATSTRPAAAKITGAPAIGLVAEAIGNLSDEATAPVIVMNKLTWAAFKQAQYAAGYNVDPFEGFAVHFNNSLPAYSAASSGAVYAIVGDFRQGTLANYPNGDTIEYTFDTLTRKKENLVEVLGEVMVAAEPVANKAFTLIAKA